MAMAPKSNASAMAVWTASQDVREGRTLPVPKHLRDTHYKGSKRLGAGKGYEYAHDHPGGYVKQDYLGVEKTYYQPTDRGFEAELGKRLHKLRQLCRRNDSITQDDDNNAAQPDDKDTGPHVC
jgi:putative ATPase